MIIFISLTGVSSKNKKYRTLENVVCDCKLNNVKYLLSLYYVERFHTLYISSVVA